MPPPRAATDDVFKNSRRDGAAVFDVAFNGAVIKGLSRRRSWAGRGVWPRSSCGAARILNRAGDDGNLARPPIADVANQADAVLSAEFLVELLGPLVLRGHFS